MKKIILIFFLFSKVTYAEIFIKSIVQINDTIITNLDIENEIKFLSILYKLKNDNNLTNIAIKNLIDETLKKSEIKKANIVANNDILNQEYNNYTSRLKETNNIDPETEKIIFQKIKLELQWNKLISSKYSWKVSVNMNEIESILKNQIGQDDSFETINKKKENIIISEKNKKLQVYSTTYLEEIKKKSLIKYIK